MKHRQIGQDMFANMTDDDHILTNLPMFHVGGLTVHTLPALHIGASVTIHREFDAEATLREIENSRITVYLPLPKISRALASHTNWQSTDISSLRITQTGSTIVPLSVMTPWTERNIPAQQIYGLTEAFWHARHQTSDDCLYVWQHRHAKRRRINQ